MRLQLLYDISPVFVQNLMVTAKGYRLKRYRYGNIYRKHLCFLMRFYRQNRCEQLEYQKRELVKLIRYVGENSSFYRELYSGVDLNSISGVEDLTKLPIVTKEMLRENIERVVTIPKRSRDASYTGGTTGMALTVYHNRADCQERMATLDAFKALNGFKNIKMRRATFSGKHIIPPKRKSKVFWRYNAAIRQMLYSSFHITDQTCTLYIDSLNRFRPTAIDGFVSSITELANFINRKKVKLLFKPKAVFTTAETLTLQMRKEIEKAFSCNVRDQYASSEGAPFIWECTHGSLHYDLSSGVIENMENSDEVLVTSFTTYGTPIVRYRIGDVIRFAPREKTCTCGLASPLVEAIEGRAVDYLVSTTGARINLGNISNIVKNTSNAIVRAQFIQTARDVINVLIVVDDKIYRNEYSSHLVEEIHRRFGADMHVSINVVEDIPRSDSGKHMLIVNRIGNRSRNAVS